MSTICRTCLKLSNNESCSYVELNAVVPESSDLSIKDKLLACVPELSINFVPDASMCNSCVTALQVTYQFWSVCLQTEDRIRNYMQKNALISVDLKSMVEFEQLGLAPMQETVTLSEADCEVLEVECRSPGEMHVEPDLINVEYTVPILPLEEAADEPRVKGEVDEVENSLEYFNKYLNQNEEVIEVIIKSEDADENMEHGSENNSHGCYKCGQCFSTQSSLYLHMNLHSKPKAKWNRGNKMKKSTLPLKRVNEHLSRAIEKKKPYKCNVCGKCFPQKGALKTHENVHKGEKPYRCNVCDRQFNFKNNLQRHMPLHEGGTLKRFKCNICEKLFTRKEHLRKHMISHTDGMPHQCNLCNKLFKYKDSLRGHLKYHSGEKRFCCDICGNGFIRRDNLFVHLRTQHGGDKSLDCDICKEEFVEKGSYEEHMKLHGGKTHYNCKTCGKLCKSKHNLRIHSNIHLKEKPHKCNICGNSFSQKRTLTYHIRTHTGEKPYTCYTCGQSFTQKASLRNHLTRHRSITRDLVKDEIMIEEKIEVGQNALEDC